MPRLLLFLILPSVSLSRLSILPTDYLSPAGSYAVSVKQPERPFQRKYIRYIVSFFNWTTDVTNLREWNDANITVNMAQVDLGIVCKFDSTPVVIRLIPADRADSCSYEGGVVAHCPDLSRIPLLYADAHGPGDYVLTTFSDGTDEGKHATSGGFCKKGVKVPIKIVRLKRDHSKFRDDKPIVPLPPRLTAKLSPSLASTASIFIGIMLSLVWAVKN